MRSKSGARVKDWVAAINDAGLRPPEGWCHPHRFGSFAPPRGLSDDGSQAQWFIDGRAAFDAIASSIEDAKSEVSSSALNQLSSLLFILRFNLYSIFWIDVNSLQIFICGWWLCPELYLRRPFRDHASSRLDSLLEIKAKQGIQVQIACLLFFPALMLSYLLHLI